MKSLVLITAVVSIFMIGCGKTEKIELTEASIPSPQLMEWSLLGIGSIEEVSEEQAVRITEGNDSAGITLVSRETYGPDVELSFQVKPEQFEGVCVIMLSISPAEGGEMFVPAGYDGNMALFTSGELQNYMYAFHTGYHQPNSFIRRNPGSVDIIINPDVATEQEWYDIVIGKSGAKLWLKVNGETVCEIEDDQPLTAGGHVGFRLRGPGDGSYSCLIRNVTIKEIE